MEELLKIGNAAPFWGCAAHSVGIVVLLALRYVKLGYKFAGSVGLDRSTCNRAFKSGMISATGPAIAQVIVILAMISVVGGPISWIRLSMIGSAATELTAARTGAAACGVELGGAGYGLNQMAVSWFTMSVNGCGWLLMVWLFTHRMDKVSDRIGGTDKAWRAILTATASIGLYSHMTSPYLVKFSGRTIAAIVGAASMFVLIQLGKKHPWLKDYSLGFAIIAGLIGGYFFM